MSGSRGFTLIEILVVAAMLAVLTVGVGLSLRFADPQREERQLEGLRQRLEQDLEGVRHGRQRLSLLQQGDILEGRFIVPGDARTVVLPVPPAPLRWRSAELNGRPLKPGESLELGAEVFPSLTLIAAAGNDGCRVRLSADPRGRLGLAADACP